MSAHPTSTLLAGRPGLLVLREGSGDPVSDRLAGASPERVIDLPVSDRATAAVAVGAALAGRRVVVEVADTSRLPALAEALVEAAALGAAVVWRAAALPGGPGVLDLLAGIPGLTVAVARDAGRAAALLADLLDAGRPAVLIERMEAACGEGVALRDGARATVIAPGAPGPALAAAERLAGEGIAVDVIDPGVVVPLDPALGDRVARTGRLVVAVPAGEAAFGRRLLQLGLDRAFLYLEAPPVVVAADAAEIAAAVRAAVAY